MKKYDGFRGTVKECMDIWESWERTVGRRTDRMLLQQYANAKGLYWNGNKLVPETAPNDQINEQEYGWWMKMLNTDTPIKKVIKDGVVEWNGGNRDQLTSDEVNELVDMIFERLEDEGHV
ncbi:MAG: hypothetical protein H6546_02790 [Chitinophagales bacterium]|nr:hypothetical protein [Chitinophagales bacterium]